MKKSFALVAAASMILVAGCGSKDDKLAGTWKANLVIPQSAMSNPMAKGMIETLQKEIQKVKLEIKKDHTFTINDGKSPVDGTWTLTDNKFKMIPKNGDKKFMAAGGSGKDQEFTVSEDSKTLTAILPQAQAAQGGGFTFTKEGS